MTGRDGLTVHAAPAGETLETKQREMVRGQFGRLLPQPLTPAGAGQVGHLVPYSPVGCEGATVPGPSTVSGGAGPVRAQLEAGTQWLLSKWCDLVWWTPSRSGPPAQLAGWVLPGAPQRHPVAARATAVVTSAPFPGEN